MGTVHRSVPALGKLEQTMRLAALFRLLPLVSLCFLSACQDPTPPHPKDFYSVKGETVLIEIHADLHYFIIKTDDGPRKAWWDQSTKFYSGLTQVQTLALSPGDKVRYLGITAYDEIYLYKLIQPHY